jgi:FkbM family methyltransferase
MTDLLVLLYRALFARRFFYGINKLLYKCSLSGLGILNYQNNRVSGEWPFLVNYLQNPSGGIVIDAGANVGNYSKMILMLNQKIKIHAFEPHPITYKQLFENLQGQDNIVTHNLALGDDEGELDLFDYKEKDGSSHASMYEDVFIDMHHAESMAHAVRVVSLDKFLEGERIEHILLLKIDIEGHKLAVLKGSTQLINSGKIDMIHFEFNEMNVISRTFFRDIWDMLPNYRFYRLLPNGMIPIRAYIPLFCEIFAYQNIVAIKSGLKTDHR